MVRPIAFHREYPSISRRTREERLVFGPDQFKDENGRCQSQFFVLVVLQAQFTEGFMRRHESCSSVASFESERIMRCSPAHPTPRHGAAGAPGRGCGSYRQPVVHAAEHPDAQAVFQVRRGAV